MRRAAVVSGVGATAGGKGARGRQRGRRGAAGAVGVAHPEALAIVPLDGGLRGLALVEGDGAVSLGPLGALVHVEVDGGLALLAALLALLDGTELSEKVGDLLLPRLR